MQSVADIYYGCLTGVYPHRPRVSCQGRVNWTRIAFEEWWNLASLGAKVLKTRSVELAYACYKAKLRVLSSLKNNQDEVERWFCAGGRNYG